MLKIGRSAFNIKIDGRDLGRKLMFISKVHIISLSYVAARQGVFVRLRDFLCRLKAFAEEKKYPGL